MPRPRPQARSLVGVLPPRTNRPSPDSAPTQPIPTSPLPPTPLDSPRHPDSVEPGQSSAIAGEEGRRRVPRGAEGGEEGGDGSPRVRHELVCVLRSSLATSYSFCILRKLLQKTGQRTNHSYPRPLRCLTLAGFLCFLSFGSAPAPSAFLSPLFFRVLGAVVPSSLTTPL